MINPYRRIRELEGLLTESKQTIAALKSDKEMLMAYNRLILGMSAPKLQTCTDGDSVELRRDKDVLAAFSKEGGEEYHLQHINKQFDGVFRQSGFSTVDGLSVVDVYDACEFLKNCFMRSYLEAPHAY